MPSVKRGFVFTELDAFFDRPGVIAAMDRKTARVLGGTGAATRTFIQRSMRPGGKKSKVSKPGEPPRWHTKLLRGSGKNGVRGIAFDYRPRDKSVAIGPLPLNSNKPAGSSNRKTIPELLEYGGTVRIKAKKIKLKRSRTERLIPARTLKYKPRPYIRPAIPYATKKMREIMERTKLK